MSQDAVLNRVRAEYLEMPGLRLTREQLQRLCGVERELCQKVLDRLVHMKFLSVNTNGFYGRLSDGAVSPPARYAKADVEPRSRYPKAV
jgi:hypothetical protein